MKIVILTTLMLVFTFSASAEDACSHQIKSYVAALEAGASFAVIDQVQRDKAIKQLKYIKTLQKKLGDCQVVDLIPELKASKKALRFASEVTNQHR